MVPHKQTNLFNPRFMCLQVMVLGLCVSVCVCVGQSITTSSYISGLYVQGAVA